MRRPDLGGALRKILLLRNIRGGLPGGKQTSSPNDAANLSEHFVARNGLHATGADFIPPPNSLRSPKPLHLVRVSEIEALDKPLGEDRS
jgi:hypothetical protein